MTWLDNRFGKFKFGTSNKFGPSGTRKSLGWDISVDWDEDGIYEVNEASHLIGIFVKRGRTRMLKPKGEGIQEVTNGTATIVLSNHDGRYNGWNSSSPLYPNVVEDKYIRVRVRDFNSGIIYPVIVGKVNNIVPSDYGSKAKVTLYVNDGLLYLRNTPANVAIQADISPSDAIDLMLSSAKWPAIWGRDLEVSADNIPYFWTRGKNAMSEIVDVSNSFFGYFYVDANGQARYLNRSNVSDLVAEYPQEYLLKDIENPQPHDIRRNVIRLIVHPRTAATLGTIFQMVGSAPYVDPGAANAFIMFPQYMYNNQSVPANNVAIETFSANSQSDFGGTDKTSSCTISLTDFGDKAKVTVTNNDASRVYINYDIEGEAIWEPNAADVTYPKDPSTVDKPRELVMDLPWQQNPNVAQDIANVIGPFFEGLHPLPTIKIENRPDIQFAPDLFSIVSADIPKIGVSGVSFRVGGIEHQSISTGIGDNCQKIVTTLHLEPYIAAGEFMIWDTASTWDTETVFGW